ncbi:MAG: membrane protein insertase YidC [Bryobacteraceae bacterium]|nr:membrane protein insertase YidC [Bryobacteraceae bacterium]
MADKPDPKKPLPGEELPVERRMLLAFGLVGVVLVLSQYVFAPSKPAAPQPASGPTTTQQATTQQAKPPAGEPPAPSAAAQAGAAPIAARAEQLTTIETKVYRIVFSNKGAVVRSWQLKAYKDSHGKPLELVNEKASEKTWWPLAFLYENQKPTTEPNFSYFVTTVTDGGLGVRFEFSDGRTRAMKSLRFGADSYLFDIVTEITDNGTGIPHLLAWRGGFGDRTAYAAASMMKTLHFDVSQNKLVENEVKVAKDGPATTGGTYSFAGIEDTYFLGVFLPRDRGTVRMQTVSDSVQLTPTDGETPVIGVGVGGDAKNEFQMFVGPKDINLLRRVNPKLEGAVDFGWFAIIAKPIFLSLHWLHDNYIPNYGWCIVALTILINMLLLPLKLSGMKGMKKMSSLQPEIQAINEKYKGIPLTDPRKAHQNEEVMALYKKHGVNPLGAGCLPLVLQIPFFFAFYKVLSVVIELRGANWLWIPDLAQFDPWYLLPVVMVVTQFVLQKMTPNTTADPAQQKMMMFMPLMFGFLFFKAQAGLVLYWLTSNIVGVVQQAFINKVTPTPAVAVASAPAKQPAKTKTRK